MVTSSSSIDDPLWVCARLYFDDMLGFEAQCPNCGNWTDDVDDKQEYACCFHCGLMKLDNIFEVREGRYVKVN